MFDHRLRRVLGNQVQKGFGTGRLPLKKAGKISFRQFLMLNFTPKI